MLKDAPLIETAWAADRTVVSTDKRARALFGRLSNGLETLRSIVWVNPEQDSEEVLRWLRRGVDPRRDWTLGSEDSRRE